MRLISGSNNGIVSVWDFEQNKAEAMYHEHSTDVTTINFCYPYPVFLSGSNIGVIVCYSLRLGDSKPSCLFKLNVMN